MKNDAERICLKIDGPAFDGGVPLHIAIDVIREFQQIVDSTFLVLTQKTRVSDTDRKVFQLVSKEFRVGSLLTDIDLVLATGQVAFAFSQLGNPRDIWMLTKECFDFLKLIFSACHSGAEPKYQFNERISAKHVGDESFRLDGTFNVTINNITNNFPAPVYPIAKKSVRHYQNLTSLLQEETVHTFQVGNSVEPDISLNLSDKGLFDIESVLDTNTFHLQCEIFRFNKYNNTGKLIVESDQFVPFGKYAFEVYGSQESSSYIESMLRRSVTLECLAERQMNPLGTSTITKIFVLKVIAEKV